MRMVVEWRRETCQPRGGVAHIAGQLGINKETLRSWVNQAEVDEGRRPGRRSDKQAYVAQLERENR